jgi:hypothetical protein
MCDPKVKANPGGSTAVGGGLEVYDKDTGAKVTKVSTTMGTRVRLDVRPSGGRKGTCKNVRWTIHRGDANLIHDYAIYPFRGATNSKEWVGDASPKMWAVGGENAATYSWDQTDDLTDSKLAHAFARGGQFLACVEADVEADGRTQHAEAIVAFDVKPYSLKDFSMKVNTLQIGWVRADGCKTLYTEIEDVSYTTDAPYSAILCQYSVLQQSVSHGEAPTNDMQNDAWKYAVRMDGWGTKRNGTFSTNVAIPKSDSGFQFHFVRVYGLFYVMVRANNGFSAEKAYEKKHFWTSPGFLHCTWEACIHVPTQTLVGDLSVSEANELDPKRGATNKAKVKTAKLTRVVPPDNLPVQDTGSMDKGITDLG